MLGKSTIKTLFIRIINEKYIKRKEDLYIIFIDLEQTYDLEIYYDRFRKKCIFTNYINVIKDMFDNVATDVRTIDSLCSEFPINIILCQGFILSSYFFQLIKDPCLFTLIKYEFSIYIRDRPSQCTLFIYDIIIVDKSLNEINSKPELWR